MFEMGKKIAVIWDVSPGSLADFDRRFRDAFCEIVTLMVEAAFTLPEVLHKYMNVSFEHMFSSLLIYFCIGNRFLTTVQIQRALTLCYNLIDECNAFDIFFKSQFSVVIISNVFGKSYKKQDNRATTRVLTSCYFTVNSNG